ncbi:MAG: YkvA family protein [Beijerinckiaceae bacterium]|nr:YkvA family protein [Beijerinckiaceae bacterium]
MDAARQALRDEENLLERMLEKLRRLARQLPFAEDLLAAYFCVRDPATPPRVRWILLLALAYFVLPVDTVPDVLPVLGFTDDAAVLAAALASVRGSLQPEHRDRARDTLDRGQL